MKPSNNIRASSPRAASFTPGPVTVVVPGPKAGDTRQLNGDPGTANPLNLTDKECVAASVGLKLT